MATLAIEPMLASIAKEPPDEPGWTFEPKFDGVRALAVVGAGSAALLTRNGRNKAAQFPQVVETLLALRRAARKNLVLDGEIVALRGGEVVRFEDLQPRIQLENAARIRQLAQSPAAAFIAFDLLLVGENPMLDQPWKRRRARRERIMNNRAGERVRLAETSPDREEMFRRAHGGGWEGVVAKRVDALYRPPVRGTGSS